MCLRSGRLRPELAGGFREDRRGQWLAVWGREAEDIAESVMVLWNLSGEAAVVAGIVEEGVWCHRCRRRCEKSHGWRGHGGPTQEELEVVRGEAAVSF